MKTLVAVGEVCDALVLGIRNYFEGAGFSKAVVGLSGGIDSAVVACLAVMALGKDNVLGISMPSRYSSEGSKDDACKLAKHLGVEIRTIPIDAPHVAYMSILPGKPCSGAVELWEENLQARIRGTILMSIANKEDRITLETGNKSEVAMGYFTLYGDSCGGLAPIADLFKTEVYCLAAHINETVRFEALGGCPIPDSTMTKTPSAELKPGQKDRDNLPADYPMLDVVLHEHIEKGTAVGEIARIVRKDESFVLGIVARMKRNEYKRKQLPPGIKVKEPDVAEGWR